MVDGIINDVELCPLRRSNLGYVCAAVCTIDLFCEFLKTDFVQKART